ncbi:hypothetical protein [Rhodobium gokarnense]|uniref:Uncharacterized protein n=1 Tax=Rhodobium gokarnense TaxID=364296 RepID=A0ABT3HCG7_9HYPH|nr:hypothetical protein [Rhodobium gokarnense]MCW2308108.1 hypothetical protein [Rhodobium gokarnense]
MAKKIASVGISLASDNVDYIDFNDRASLLDWDIVIFRPEVNEFIRYDYKMSEYQGKPCLSDGNSFALKEACDHWRRELGEAVEIGKTVIAHLCKPAEVFVQTGQKKTSGTGKNQKVTRIVDNFDSYCSIPVDFNWHVGRGREIVLRPEYQEVLASYWRQFGPLSNYEVVIPDIDKNACLTTKHGDRAVGLIVGHQISNGALLLLPDMDFAPDHFFSQEEDQTDEDDDLFTADARTFAASYIDEVMAIDRALRQGAERTSEPGWANATDYLLSAEGELQQELLRAEEALEQAQKRKEDLKAALVEAGELRGLLYESGKPLEAAILKALRILGFSAENYDDGKSEFDAVFSSPEGRLLGEAEGKDTKAIAISKLRQLAMNIHEDLERDEVSKPAKGVLFGNAYRLTPPSERSEPFTEKCVTSAKSQSVALIHTPDLFAVCRYVIESGDTEFATKCREAVVHGIGLVAFPETPTADAGQATGDEIASNESLS